MNKMKRKILIALLAMILLVPAGLFLPELFHSGDAWGEWSTSTVEKKLGYVPEGMSKEASKWKAPLPDYNNISTENSPVHDYVWYILSGVAGSLLIAGGTYWLYLYYKKNE